MTVFRDKPRPRRDLMRRGEGAFPFFDSCGREAFDTFRSLVNGWAAELPTTDQPEIRDRMRKGDDQQFYAALAELMVHAMLKRLGHRVKVHPKLEGTGKTPDFLAVSTEDKPLAYVEVTTFGSTPEEISRARRAAQVEWAVTNARLPDGCRLDYSLNKAAPNTPRLNRLVGQIEEWGRSTPDMGKRMFEIDGWSIELTLFTGFGPAVPATGVIAGLAGDVRWVSGAMEIREALEGKASKYGSLNAPYVIVVTDCKEEIIGNGRNELTNALLGDEVVEDHLSASGTVRTYLIRQGGFWFKGKKPVHTNVSAVVLFPTPGIWHLREPDWAPFMALNPWAEYPLTPALLPLPHFAARDDKWTLMPGEAAADILGLPAEWPPTRK